MGPLLLTTLSTLWPLLAPVAALAVLGAVLRHPRVKGWRGEQRVQRMIREGLNPHLYVDLHNVTLPTADGGSTQIGHLIFSPYGVFVLETKNLKGWIFGSERQAEWTQKIHANHSQKFQNPLRQNYLHTQTVRAMLGLPADQVHSVVAFVGESQFKTDMPPQVLQSRAFIGYILQFQQQIWGPEAMQDLIDTVEQHRQAPGSATDRAHAAQVQQRRERKARAAPQTQAQTQMPGSAPLSAEVPAGAQPGTRPQARRAAPTPQQVAAAPVLQEVVEGVAQPTMADATPRATAAGTEPLPASQTTSDAATAHMASTPVASVAPAVRAIEPVAPAAADVHIAVGGAEKMGNSGAAMPAAAPAHAHAAPQAPLARPAPATPGAPAARPSRTCPQCQSALGRMRLQRGPLAGQVIYRCSNTALCQYVQPLPDSMPAPVGA